MYMQVGDSPLGLTAEQEAKLLEMELSRNLWNLAYGGVLRYGWSLDWIPQCYHLYRPRKAPPVDASLLRRFRRCVAPLRLHAERGARGMCDSVAAAFHRYLSHYGISSEVVWLFGRHDDLHCVVRVDSQYIDWTSRQYGDSLVPAIYSESDLRRQGWERFQTETDDLIGPPKDGRVLSVDDFEARRKRMTIWRLVRLRDRHLRDLTGRAARDSAK